MYARRRVPLKLLLFMAVQPVLICSVWTLVVFFLYAYLGWTFLRLPFLPVATVGTAVAFYVGFKNNSSYERFWEGRKIWGGIVNESRTWAAAVLAYLDGEAATAEVKKRLVYRHLAWINALRVQLRARSRFFDKPAGPTKRRLQKHEAHMRNDWELEVAPFLSKSEREPLIHQINAATQLLKNQAVDLADLKSKGALDLFHQIDLMQVVRALYALQGKCERIKNTPFPRQYAEFSRWFTRAFIFLVPCGLLSIFEEEVAHAAGGWQRILVLLPMFVSSALIGWVFVTMEAIGDASEDPFERSVNDVPMNALCRAIERDLREMLGETELPEVELTIDDILY